MNKKQNSIKIKRNTSLAIRYKEKHSKCVNCGCEDFNMLMVHHIVPLSNGGLDVESNMVTLCAECHNRAHGKAWNNKKGSSGRNAKVSYEDAIPYLEKYFSEEIGQKELKEYLHIGKMTKVSDNTHVKRYKKENNIVNFYNHVDILSSAKKRHTQVK